MFDRSGIDEEASDPPVRYLAGAVLGLCVAAGGFGLLTLDLFTLLPGLLAALPPLLVEFSPFVMLAGLAIFVASMTEWDPEVG